MQLSKKQIKKMAKAEEEARKSGVASQGKVEIVEVIKDKQSGEANVLEGKESRAVGRNDVAQLQQNGHRERAEVPSQGQADVIDLPRGEQQDHDQSSNEEVVREEVPREGLVCG